MGEETASFIDSEEGANFLKGEDGTFPYDYPALVSHGTIGLLGEGGEHEGWQYGEEDVPIFPRHKTTVKPQSDEDEEKKNKVLESFYKINSGRQELRRKNVFLQKKLVEFFKKRKMDHVLKEDPKGLDLENKYLKRLKELQLCKQCLEEERKKLSYENTDVTKKANKSKDRAEKELRTFLDLQRKVAEDSLLKTGKHISTKAINNFLEIQERNIEELSRLRLSEIKMKKQMLQNQEIVKSLDSIGHGLRKSDYEQLLFEYQMESKRLEEKSEDMKKTKGKLRLTAQKLDQAQHRATIIDHELTEWRAREMDSKQNLNEVTERLHKLERMRSKLIAEEGKLKKTSGLLTCKSLLYEFENSLKEAEELKNQLESEEKRQISNNGRTNTPTGTEFISISLADNRLEAEDGQEAEDR